MTSKNNKETQCDTFLFNKPSKKDKSVTAKPLSLNFGATYSVKSYPKSVGTEDDYDRDSCIDKVIFSLRTVKCLENLKYDVIICEIFDQKLVLK